MFRKCQSCLVISESVQAYHGGNTYAYLCNECASFSFEDLIEILNDYVEAN